MNMLRLCGVVTGLAILCVSFIYAVFEPIELNCLKANGYLQTDIPASSGVQICTRYDTAVMTLLPMLAGVITLFGTMAIRGAQNADGNFSEQRVRLAIALSLLVVYLVCFGMALQWNSKLSPMFATLTDLMKVIVPFYFGASAIAHWADKRGAAKSEKDDSKVAEHKSS